MHQYRSLLFRIVLATFGIYAFTEVYYLFANYLAELDMSSARAGILVGAFFASTILCRPFGGVITERLGVRRTMIAAACLCGAGSLGLLGAGHPSGDFRGPGCHGGRLQPFSGGARHLPGSCDP
jgi:MFS family permease